MNKKVKYTILMIGPGATDNIGGGVVTVIDNLMEIISKRFNIVRIITMRPTSFFYRLYIYLNAICSLIYQILFTRSKKLAHVHMASKTSFYRKSLLIILLKSCNIPILVHLHGASYHIFYRNSGALMQKYIKWIFSITDKTILLSDSWQEWYINAINTNQSSVIYNGVTDYYNNKSLALLKRQNEILFLGRIGERKGIYDLLHAFQKVVKVIPDAILKIGGDGEVDKAKDLTSKLNLSKNVEFLGWVNEEEKYKLLNNAKVYILPSYNEGLPMGLLEGMSAGLAVISTDVGGIPEVIENEKNGLLIKAGNKIQITNSLIKVLTNNQLLEELGESARKSFLKSFNSKIMTNKVEEIYDEILK
jgi:glycosyltransferase involved in cell wall biosynthesis